MTTYEKYPEYKTSPNSWIGSIPAHWNIMRADFLVQTNRQHVSAESLNGMELIHYSIPNVQEFGTGKLEDGDRIDSAKLLISEEQLLVSKLNPRKSTICIAAPDDQYTVVASSEFVPLLAGKTNLEYSYYVWGSDKVKKLLSSMVQSVTRSHQRVNPSDIIKIYWAWPPSHEQKAIAQFLDHKTAQIDALIAKKQSLLDKLAEQRTALISQAVTKGLDLSVPMKDSGVNWLGEIPAHWSYKRLKFLVAVQGGGTPNTGSPEYWNGDIPWVSPKDMKYDFIDTTEDYLTQKGVEESATSLINSNAVLIVVRSGILRHTIPVARNTCLVSLNQDMKALTTTKEITPGYLHWFINGLQKGLLPLWSKPGCTVESIELNYLLNTHIPLPPHYEQQQIEDYVADIREGFNNRMAKVESIIQKLNEYRSALITNAVTGKIDVQACISSVDATRSNTMR